MAALGFPSKSANIFLKLITGLDDAEGLVYKLSELGTCYNNLASIIYGSAGEEIGDRNRSTISNGSSVGVDSCYIIGELDCDSGSEC